MAAFAFSSSILVCSFLPRTTAAPSSSPPLCLSTYHDTESAETTTIRPPLQASRPPLLVLVLLLAYSLHCWLLLGGDSGMDDDEVLLERVKRDRKKRLEKQGVINSSKNETAYLQKLVYKLSKVGQAIDNNDLSPAGDVLGPNKESDWVKNADAAFNKMSSSSEEESRGYLHCFIGITHIISGQARRELIKDSVRVLSYGS